MTENISQGVAFAKDLPAINTMDPLRRNPLLEITKCEMCSNLVYHFPTGLCARCLTLWAGKKPMDGLRLTVDQSKAFLVNIARCSDAQDKSHMDPTFQRVIAEVRLQRQQKLELFQKIRQQLQLSVLTGSFYDKNPKYEVNEDYWNIPDIVDADMLMFQKNIDLLADIPTISSEINDENKYNKRENRKRNL